MSETAPSGFTLSWARNRLAVLVAEIPRVVRGVDGFMQNLGMDLREFNRDPSPFTASMLAWALQIVARRQRRSADALERIAVELEIHAVEQEVEERLAAQAQMRKSA